MSLRKIGGIHWLAVGRLRVSFCVKRKVPNIVTQPVMPVREIYPEFYAFLPY